MPKLRISNVANMSFNAISENKILAKISEFYSYCYYLWYDFALVYLTYSTFICENTLLSSLLSYNSLKLNSVKQSIKRLFIYYNTNSQKISSNGHFVKTSLRLTSQGSHRNSKSQFHHFSMILHDQQCNFHVILFNARPLEIIKT